MVILHQGREMAIQDGFQARERRADDPGIDFYLTPGGDVHFEDGEVDTVEGREERY
jgi:hypothetical protein